MSSSQSTGVYNLFVGVDIAAATATVSWTRPGEKASRPMTIEQTPDGYASLEQKLRATGKVSAEVLVVIEATGAYWITPKATFIFDLSAAARYAPPAYPAYHQEAPYATSLSDCRRRRRICHSHV